VSVVFPAPPPLSLSLSPLLWRLRARSQVVYVRDRYASAASNRVARLFQFHFITVFGIVLYATGGRACETLAGGREERYEKDYLFRFRIGS